MRKMFSIRVDMRDSSYSVAGGKRQPNVYNFVLEQYESGMSVSFADYDTQNPETYVTLVFSSNAAGLSGTAKGYARSLIRLSIGIKV